MVAPLAVAQDPPIAVGGLAEGRFARMYVLVEKTFLGIDAYSVEIRIDPPTQRKIAGLAGGKEYSEALAKRIAGVAYRAENSYTRVVFHHEATFDQFIEGVRGNLRQARNVGMIDEETYAHVVRELPRSFAFLKDRGVREGDQVLHRARASSVRTVFLDAKGRELLDRTDRGAKRRFATLGAYLAPGTDSHEPLIRSLFED